MVKEVLKGLKNNNKKKVKGELQNAHEKRKRTETPIKCCIASFLIWLLHHVKCGLLGSVEQGAAILHTVHKERYTALYMQILITNLIIILDLIILIIQYIVGEHE